MPQNFPDTDFVLHEAIIKAANSAKDAQFKFSVLTSQQRVSMKLTTASVGEFKN